MKKRLFLFKILLFTILVAFPTKNFSQDKALEGSWLGKLKLTGIELHLVFHIKYDSLNYSATFDSPDQGVNDIPVSSVELNNDSVRIELKVAAAIYTGIINKEMDQIVGQWRQGGKIFPINFVKTTKQYKLDRPQEPKEPFPYKSKEITFFNEVDSIKLTGTLTIPEGNGTFPAVILITGSGPQNRNEEILGHKPFLVISDYLTRNGIAVLRFDDRGVGKSGGKFKGSLTTDFASDVNSAVKFLLRRIKIDSKKIGLIGHSEGGLIAPMVAVQNKNVAFIIMLAGPGIPGYKLLTKQVALISKANGENENDINTGIELNKLVFSTIAFEKDSTKAVKEIKDLMGNFYIKLSKEEQEKIGSKDKFFENTNQLMTPWFRSFLSYDPRPILEKVTAPVLAINGSKDLQVPPKEDLTAIGKALLKGGNLNFTIKEIEGLNHLFQTALTGSPKEYIDISETFSPKVLKLMKDWILGITEN